MIDMEEIYIRNIDNNNIYISSTLLLFRGTKVERFENDVDKKTFITKIIIEVKHLLQLMKQ